MTARLRVRPSSVIAVGLLIATLALVAPLGAPAASAATGSCRSVTGVPAATGGPQRATVVVDTGAGAVWSACISFSGTISGVDALELAKAQIPGLAPVYDIYVGQGRAVCRLRGVGNDPPDCLGRSVEYWGYFRNGRYSSIGAGAVTVRDGDVEGWRWGTSGATPRRATEGYEAAAHVAPPPTAAPTTRPPAPPTTAATRPPGGSTATLPPASGGATGAGPQGTSGEATTTSAVPAAGGVPPSTSSTTSMSTAAGSGSGGPPATSPADAGEAAGAGSGERAEGGDELAAGVAGAPGGPSLDEGDGGSSAASMAAFAGALVAVAGVGLVLRRRRTAGA